MVFSSFSSCFVSPLFPAKGEDVEISIAFSSHQERVLLKYYTDNGLIYQKEMSENGSLNGEILYSAKVPVSSDEFPFTYFFVFFEGNKSYYYSKSGVTRSCPSRKERFKLIGSLNAPEWIASSTCYQIFPDRFSIGDRSVGAISGMYEFDGGVVTTPDFSAIPKSYEEARCLDFYNGDLKGIEDKVDYFKSLGIDCLYLNPITCSRTVHRFDSTDFFHVDEKLGGDEALISLINTMHENGIKVIVDISINHTSSDSPWLKEALADKDSIYNSFYMIGEDGKPRCWQGVPTLVQLDYRSKILRGRIYSDYDSALKKFLRPPFNQDGWRLDVAPELGRAGDIQLCQEVWRELRSELKGVKKDCYLVGEEWDDASDYMQGDMWDGTMNYFGSGRLIRSWLGERDRFLSSGWGHSPEEEASWSGYDLAEALKRGIDATPDQMAFFQMNLFDSHDTPRLHNNSAIYNKRRYFGGLIILYLLPGMPNIYYGDEIAISGTMGSVEGSRYPMDWNKDNWDMETYDFHRLLGSIRDNDWLGYSSFDVQAIDDDAIAIKRISNNKAFVGIVNKSKSTRTVSIPTFLLPKSKAINLTSSSNVWIENDTLYADLDSEESVIIEMN